MKSKIKRLLALVLCLTMVLNGNVSLLASDEAAAEDQVAAEAVEEMMEEVAEEATEETIEEVTEEVVEEVVEEETAEEAIEEVAEESENVVEEVVESEIASVEVVDEETTKELLTYTWKNDGVTVEVTEKVAGAIPAGVELSVKPIVDGQEYKDVETQLQEKAENEEYEIAGFLAYDICFVDAQGNEIEPNDNVNVLINFEEAVIPEMEVAEDAELDVTVMHFEEDANGEVAEIVDMVADENEEATVTTTAMVEVEKAEFVTDSFSTYTVTWTYKNTNTFIVTLIPHYGYLNENGQFVEFAEQPTKKITAVEVSSQSDINLAEYANTDVFESEEYLYDGSYIVEGNGAYSNSTQATNLSLRQSSGNANTIRFEYSNGGSYSTFFDLTRNDNNKVCSIYYVYKTPPRPIETVDSKTENINISVSDYSIWSSSQKQWDHTVQYNINDGHALQFAVTGNTGTTPNYNAYTGGSSPRQGFINKNLAAGYPKIKAANESLDYLFNNGYDANYLFKKLDGYYVYDSAQNFASLDTTTGNFRVYSEPNKGFFPFNEFTEDLKIESASTSTVENHHSGMHVDFTFMQPKNGKTSDNAEMIFEFSGDDDVWVFIDGVLVLDLGGIHQPTGGTINFATGAVTYTNATDTTLYNAYVEAIKEQNPSMSDAEAKTKAKELFVEYETGKYRFKDYSQHTLDFFYLERGAHDSNCMIKFNLLSIPANSVFIEKEITKSNMADFADAEFKFVIEKKDVKEDGSYPTASTVLSNVTYKLYEVDSAGNRTYVETRTTNSAGEFTLKHRQVAEFSNIPASTKYCVTEMGVTSEVYDNVTVNGSNITISSSETADGLTKHDYVTGDLLAQEHVYVTFENQCNVTNLRNLIIRKEMVSGQESSDEFDIKLEFAEGDGWIPYVGDYYLGSSTGDKQSTTNGIITLKANQEAHIIGLITDTEYRVTEILDESQQKYYGEPAYSGTGTVETIDNVKYITDTIELTSSKDYMATVTNSLHMVVNVNKVWVDSETSHESIYVGLYKQEGNSWSPYSEEAYKELTNGSWSASFTGLNGGVYDVKELVPVDSEDDLIDFTIDGVGYVATNDYCLNNSHDYSVSYSKENLQNTTNVTITNTRLGKIVIEKVSKNNNDFKLSGAEFKLQKFDIKENAFVDLKTGITDDNGLLIFDKLELGTYQIIETKAPSGYILSEEVVTVELLTTNEEVEDYQMKLVIENEALYSLPSTGGLGIYIYMIGGIMLMAFATFVLYKNRRKEVLARY